MVTSGSKGQRWGWKGGFLGGSCWVPVLAVVLFAQGDVFGGVLTLVCYALCLGALWRFLPWRFPGVRLWKLYLASLGPIVLSALVLGWRLGKLAGGVGWPLLQLLFVLPMLLLPLLTMGRKTWDELEKGAPAADD